MGRVHIYVSPGAGRNDVQVQPDGEYRVHISARAVEGKANGALLLYLSRLLQVPKSRVHIPRGDASRHKVIEVEGLRDDEVRAGIEQRGTLGL